MNDDLAKQLRTDAKAYRQSLASPDTDDMFSLAYQWQDKKHRHVYDLCGKLETAADRIERLEAALARIAKHDMQAIAMDALRPGERIRKALDAE
tara:strand:+ start:968 stop:1249 length:282 start_codon:yes stop_codon:yes gene_type:complete